MVRKICCIFMAIIVIGMCGCVIKIEKTDETETGSSENTSKVVNTEKKKYELNERQIEILESVGLPGNYTELTISQKRAIKEIEELLEVLESKYNIGFKYDGYVAASPIEYASLDAYAENNSFDLVTITKIVKEGEVTYKDNYMAVCVRDYYEEYIRDYFVKALDTENIKVHSSIGDTLIDEVPKQYEELDGKVGSSNIIFIDGNSCSDEQLGQVLSGFKEWIEEHNLMSFNQIIRLKEDYFGEVNRYNYGDYLSDDYYISRDDCNSD